MRYLAQLDSSLSRVFYIIEDEGGKVQFAPDFPIVDVTNLDPRPQQGWYYNQDTGEFYTKTPALQVSSF